MKTRTVALTVLAALAGMLVFSPGVLGARPSDAGNGGGGGSGGNEPPDYGDLIILYRNENGVPYLTADGCWQPIPSDSCPEACLAPGTPAGPSVVSVDPATCAVTAECALCTQEVEFGRINEARSPDTVFEAQLDDVVVNLATADCVTLDPAGRLVTSRVEDGMLVTSAIDSPLQNLAIYRQLMLVGYLGDEATPIELPADVLDTAARALGAASDKTGEVNVDLLAYLNQILGLSDPATATVLYPKLCIEMKEEVMGQVQFVEKCFLNYSDYRYRRTDSFGALPAPAYIPGLSGLPMDGWFEYLAVLDDTVPTFEIARGSILEAVFDDEPGFTDGNIGGFAQAADDARAVINFMHEWPVPDEDVYATQVPCVASGVTTNDVSISDVSGLQVPKTMVDGTEGREFTVSITNEGPDPTTGNVTVTAMTTDGDAIDGASWTFPFADLAAGESKSWTEFFSINLGRETTIAWTATVYATDDVNLSNDSVTETTIVKVTGGGGGRHH